MTTRVVFPLADHWSLPATFETEYTLALAALAGAPTIPGDTTILSVAAGSLPHSLGLDEQWYRRNQGSKSPTCCTVR